MLRFLLCLPLRSLNVRAAELDAAHAALLAACSLDAALEQAVTVQQCEEEGGTKVQEIC